MVGLIEKLEAATEGSRELDAEIELNRRDLLKAFAAGTVSLAVPGWLSGPALGESPVRCPRYTTSVDSALTLVPDGVLSWTVCDTPGGPTARIFDGDEDHLGFPAIGCNSPALALVIAALRARGV